MNIILVIQQLTDLNIRLSTQGERLITEYSNQLIVELPG